MSPANKIVRQLLQSILLLGCLVPVGYAADGLNVLLVLSDSNALYQNFANTYRQSLPVGVQLHSLQRAEDFNGQHADLVVTVGVKAAERVAMNTTQPMLAVMIPSHSYAGLLAQRPGNKLTSAIFLDQPWHRQVSFLRAVLPERRKIGVLYSTDTRLEIAALRSELSDHGFTLIGSALGSDDDLFTRLESVLTASDVLLAVPDSAIYSSNNIRNILLSSYRRSIPLVGFSQSYVRAGALCAIFSTPEQLAAQASRATVSFSQTRKLPDAQYPVFYEIAVNHEVARTLGLSIKPAESLRLQLEKLSENPR
ncbi:MAG: ABC transporter substrate binding protein [Gallionella sp.]|nr:ABC transporter substrate binding protein [Gallionella sp.]MDP1941433.1 ABC transporter substrate binding protein [Gallionella sp.]